MARHLAVSERTLRRRLAEENTSFRELADEVHRVLAEELLGTGALSVDDIALRLGYGGDQLHRHLQTLNRHHARRYQRSMTPRARLVAGIIDSVSGSGDADGHDGVMTSITRPRVGW
ncbi:helix-turn-helix domain-containing protein [Mycobacterium tilburgii]|uniref:helix-turn-helix domain-containing protein n=1 Tax=Mycobacterium tilburgii TaxID=44467 RepID=UPI0021B3617B|nr:helix-turn-helix domain-containing protein [Mycobacterium tilburgii]